MCCQDCRIVGGFANDSNSLKAAAAAAVTTPMSLAPKGLVEALLCSCASPTLAELVKA